MSEAEPLPVLVMTLIARSMPVALCLVSVVSSAQENPTPNPSPTVYRVCSETQPQPCATRPQVTNDPSPEYSDEARRKRVQGTTELSLTVGSDGRAHDIKVVKRLGHGLDEKAVEAVAMWTFDPGTKDAKPVTVLIDVTVTFNMYP